MAGKNLYSPLRYPGGKGKMSPFFKDVIETNNLRGCTYYELYAGGSAIALDLLLSNVVQQIVLNDADYHIYSLWNSILNDTDNFLRKLKNCTISIQSWKRHRNIYLDHTNHSELEVGFSTFFLNRCNRSGILTKAGPIGGIEQKGNYLIDARFNKKELIKRIKKIALRRNDISIFNLDTLNFIQQFRELLNSPTSFIYMDPPYYQKGGTLYLNHYSNQDHVDIANELERMRNLKWIVTYDHVPEIENLYATFRTTSFSLNYSLQQIRKAKEIMILSDNILLPSNFLLQANSNQLNMAV